MYLALDAMGIMAFLAIGLVFSHGRKKIDWKSVGILTVLNLAPVSYTHLTLPTTPYV